MKFSIKGQIPSPDDVTGDLRVDRDPMVRMARDSHAGLQTGLGRARQRLTDASVRVSELRILVPAGEARIDELETAMTSERAAALVIPGYEARVDDAAAAVTRAVADATAGIISEAARRRDKLQQIADEFTPVLEALREAEGALDWACKAVGGHEVAPLAWPQTLDDEGRLRNQKIAMAGTGR